MRVVREEARTGAVPGVVHPDWSARFGWLVQGTTAPGDVGFDLRLFGERPGGVVLERWRLLREETGARRIVHARQAHGTTVLRHDAGSPGLFLAEEADGHATRAPGVLLTVALADCVPVFVVSPDVPAAALLHAGWRGTAAGILAAGLEAMEEIGGGAPSELLVHLGPGICGSCYEVGPEVHEALGLPVPEEPRPVDLRMELARRAGDAGVPPASITVSAHCTRCGPAHLYSHRGGDEGRQVAFLGIRSPDDAGP